MGRSLKSFVPSHIHLYVVLRIQCIQYHFPHLIKLCNLQFVSELNRGVISPLRPGTTTNGRRRPVNSITVCLANRFSCTSRTERAAKKMHNQHDIYIHTCIVSEVPKVIAVCQVYPHLYFLQSLAFKVQRLMLRIQCHY